MLSSTSWLPKSADWILFCDTGDLVVAVVLVLTFNLLDGTRTGIAVNTNRLSDKSPFLELLLRKLDCCKLEIALMARTFTELDQC